jgi:alpha-D-xyloside xylohydrolase
MRLARSVLMALAALACAAAGAVERTRDGVVVTAAEGAAGRVRLQVMGPAILHVTATPEGGGESPASLMVTAKPAAGGFRVRRTAGAVTLSTQRLSATVSLAHGRVSVRGRSGIIFDGSEADFDRHQVAGPAAPPSSCRWRPHRPMG